MINAAHEHEDNIRQLAALGLSEKPVLHSTGLETHRKRLEAGEVNPAQLTAYAADLQLLLATTAEAGAAIPIDFWDVQSETMKAAGIDEYEMAHKLAAPELQPYVKLLARCYGMLTEFKHEQKRTAVATALGILQEAAAYVRAAHTVEMTRSLSHMIPRQQAIFLWQQMLTGTNRQVPYLGRDAYTHSYWGRFNMTEMWRYEIREDAGTDGIWGLSGFDDAFIRDPHNTNQIEHMAITSLAQIVLRLPLMLLNVLEDLESLLHKASWIEGAADKALNRAVARHFCPLFSLEDPQPACQSLERALARR